MLVSLLAGWALCLLPTTNATPSLPATANPNMTNTSRNDPSSNELFHWEDYSVLASMLIISCGIGVFYGYFGEKPTSGDDFLLGGSSMGTFPTALSLAAR